MNIRNPNKWRSRPRNERRHKCGRNSPAPMKQQAPGNAAANGAGRRNVLGGGDPNNVPRAMADDSKRPQRVVAELSMSKVTRAIYSERQLQQVMDDFWFNHFNIFAGKGEDR